MLGYISFKELGKIVYLAFFNESEFRNYKRILQKSNKVFNYKLYVDKELFYKDFEGLLKNAY